MFLPLEIPFPRIDPAAFTIPLPDMMLGPIHLGAFPVRWYALGYIVGLEELVRRQRTLAEFYGELFTFAEIAASTVSSGGWAKATPALSASAGSRARLIERSIISRSNRSP